MRGSWQRSLTFLVGWAILVSLVAAAAEENATIKGKITFEGAQVAEGKVVFHPEMGKPIEVKLKDGAYTVDKAPLGEMTIIVEANGVPAKYADPKKSPLRVTVVKGRNELNIDLNK
jgi:hypothetical protein